MRGIAFIGGEWPRPGTPGLTIAADLVVAADSGLVAAEELSVRPDWIVGDMDSLDHPSRLDRYPADRVLRFSTAKDDTDTEIAIDLLRRHGCDDIRIIGGGGGRLDHLLGIFFLFERENPPSRWTTATDDVFLLDPEKNSGAMLATCEPNTLISVFPIGTGPWSAQSLGLKWPLNGLAWGRGRFGLSNVAETGSAEITVTRGRFLVILPLASRVERFQP